VADRSATRDRSFTRAGPNREDSEEAMRANVTLLLLSFLCTVYIACALQAPSSNLKHVLGFRRDGHSGMENRRQIRSITLSQTATNLQLRGGKREIPLDMKMFHWWDTSPWAWVITALCGVSFVYLLPGFPKITKLNPVLVAEGKIGAVLFVLGSMLLLAAPVIQDALGWWTHGFAPISETIILMGVVLIAHAIGETIADARDKALEEDTMDPYQPSFVSNYRWKG
jgi:hypothetical protein